MKHRRLLPPQLLETRTMHAVWGNPWPNPQTLQFSFAADGSPVESQVSALFQKLDSQMPRQEWQYKSLLALQSWSQHAQLNFSVVDDSGIRFGVNSAQGSAGVGDIRLGAAALTHRELAVAAPFDLATDWSGDVLLNSQYSFETATGFDLYTVLLQEFGHALSLPPSEQNDSVLYGKYLGVRSGLSDIDILAIQSLYGERQDDRFDREQRNDTFATASHLTFVNDVDQFIGIDPRDGSAPFIATADITTLDDRDLYHFEVPIDVNSFEAIVRGQGISLLHARVAIYDSTGIQLYEQTSADPWSNDVRISISLDACYRELFLEVSPSQQNPFGIGSYEISVGKESQEALYPNATPFFADDIGDDDDGTDTTIVLGANTDGSGVLW